MLCQTCPKRSICKSPCIDLSKDLRKFESPHFEFPISNIESKIDEQKVEIATPEISQIDLQKLRQFLALLTSNERSCIEKFYWDGKSQHQIARELRLTQSGVSRLMQSAIHKLRQNYSSPDTLYIETHAA